MRTYLLWKCGGLDAAGLRATLGASPLTLGGLLKHLSAVEAVTFAWKLHGRRPFPPFDEWDWDDEGSAFRVEDDDTPESLETLFKESVAQGQALVDEAIASVGLGGQADIADDQGTHANVRRLVYDMIEEYGRHVGHADLIRESVDGLTGEDPGEDWRP
ncbi:DinB family protein [Nocardioides hankookensis]